MTPSPTWERGHQANRITFGALLEMLGDMLVHLKHIHPVLAAEDGLELGR